MKKLVLLAAPATSIIIVTPGDALIVVGVTGAALASLGGYLLNRARRKA
jgi:hypothetical protein